MIGRRNFLALGAAAPVAALVPSLNATPTMRDVKTRSVGKVDIAFPSPIPKPNGLQCTSEGLWIMHQDEANSASLVNYDTGKIIRSFPTETNKSSGLTYHDGTLWIGSTYSREIVHCDASTGKTIEKLFTPGAGVIYEMVGDAPARRSPLAKPRAPRPAPAPGETVGGFAQGRLMGAKATGTGAHGQEWRDGKLWMAVPPARMIFCLDPTTWVVQKRFDSVGNRPHGIGWEGKYLWCTDSNLNAFFKHDTDTGEVVEKIQLAESDPLPHGMSIWQGTMWYCDDVGVICRLKIA
ncbi:MAG: hypothetical protein ABSA57_06790 [Candidatus Acidiferrales bacterium]|jgi:hypothetical protein